MITTEKIKETKARIEALRRYLGAGVEPELLILRIWGRRCPYMHILVMQSRLW